MIEIFTPIVRCIVCPLAISLVAFAHAGGANFTSAGRVTERSPKTSPDKGLKLTVAQNGDHHWALVIYAQLAGAVANKNDGKKRRIAWTTDYSNQINA